MGIAFGAKLLSSTSKSRSPTLPVDSSESKDDVYQVLSTQVLFEWPPGFVLMLIYEDSDSTLKEASRYVLKRMPQRTVDSFVWATPSFRLGRSSLNYAGLQASRWTVACQHFKAGWLRDISSLEISTNSSLAHNAAWGLKTEITWLATKPF